jgi:signal transduction histidine kinase
MSNVARHAHGSVVRVRLAEVGTVLLVRVEDDGFGIEPSAATGGLGMATMRERAEELGGTLTLSSSPSGGTIVSALIPVTDPTSLNSPAGR